MSQIILICESLGKVKKLQEYAGSNYTVIPSYGHIRELAKTGTQSLGFNLDAQKKRVSCNYITRNSNSKKVLNKLLDAIKNSNQVVLATDEDREGEFISWHLWDALNLGNRGIKVMRVTFNEITQKAVQNALANPRQIDMNLVNAAKARSCLDKLVGFSLSPLLWQTGTGAKSAGRCQSAALHLLAEREKAVQSFQPEDYWLVRSHYTENLVGVVHLNNKELRFSSEEEA
ncbi:MAG: type IA DNA topoisomerase [Oscillatoriales cyanobacterium RM2_1_1]|nr:type IA DNA topoisomerase [Oscillatoriales cyanobacterium RM2_1_1]